MYRLYCEDKVFEFETLEELHEKEKELIELVSNQRRRSAILEDFKYEQEKVHRG